VSDMMRARVGDIVTISTAENSAYGERYCVEGMDCYWSKEMLEPISESKILITTNGKTTTATLFDGKRKVKSAEAKCAPDDIFNFETGAKLAFNRLMFGYWTSPPGNQYKNEGYNGESEKKYFTGDVVCSVNFLRLFGFTEGRLYHFKDGFVKDDKGKCYPGTPCESVDEWNATFSTKFRPATAADYLKPEKPVFNWDEFNAGKIIVRCDTGDKAKAFLKECRSGLPCLRWHSGVKPDQWFPAKCNNRVFFVCLGGRLIYTSYLINMPTIDYPFTSGKSDKPNEYWTSPKGKKYKLIKRKANEGEFIYINNV